MPVCIRPLLGNEHEVGGPTDLPDLREHQRPNGIQVGDDDSRRTGTIQGGEAAAESAQHGAVERPRTPRHHRSGERQGYPLPAIELPLLEKIHAHHWHAQQHCHEQAQLGDELAGGVQNFSAIEWAAVSLAGQRWFGATGAGAGQQAGRILGMGVPAHPAL